jgi:hypothetical protein
MSDEPGKREKIATLMGSSSEEPAEAWLLAYWLGSKIEIVVTEEHGAHAAVLLSKDQARELARALGAALDNGPQH